MIKFNKGVDAFVIYTKFIGMFLFALALFLIVLSAGPQTVENVPSQRPAPNTEAAVKLKLDLEKSGLKCHDESDPVLTDKIVVKTETSAKIMTFDEAYAAAKKGEVTVFAYCL